MEKNHMQLMFTPAMGKELIARGVAAHPKLQHSLRQGTVVITCGTTNAYVAAYLLGHLGQAEGFDPLGFFRGIVRPFGAKGAGAAPGNEVVLVKGVWKKEFTVAEVAPTLGEDDLVLKGANAIDLRTGESALLIGHPQGGTAGWVIPAVIGRRCGLLVPAGVEKRVEGPLSELALEENSRPAKGLRLCTLPGELFTELDALKLLFNVESRIIAAGGVTGAEGGVWLSCRGSGEDLAALKALYDEIKTLPGYAG